MTVRELIGHARAALNGAEGIAQQVHADPDRWAAQAAAGGPSGGTLQRQYLHSGSAYALVAIATALADLNDLVRAEAERAATERGE